MLQTSRWRSSGCRTGSRCSRSHTLKWFFTQLFIFDLYIWSWHFILFSGIFFHVSAFCLLVLDVTLDSHTIIFFLHLEIYLILIFHLIFSNTFFYVLAFCLFTIGVAMDTQKINQFGTFIRISHWERVVSVWYRCNVFFYCFSLLIFMWCLLSWFD